VKEQKYDGATGRAVLTGMIVNETILGRVASKWAKPGLFASRWENLVGQWCVDYWERYNKPPEKDVEGLFRRWTNKARDEATVSLVDSFLSGLSGEYTQRNEELNPDFVVDQAGELFQRVKLARLSEAVEASLEAGEVKEAEGLVENWSRIELGQGSFEDPFTDKASVYDTFALKPEDEVLFRYPGPLGRFFGGAFARDNFVGLMAPDKTGKSFWLLDIAYRALEQHRKVAFFEVGDMSRRQVKIRLMVRNSVHPYRSNNPDGTWPCTVRWPVSLLSPPRQDDENKENKTKLPARVKFKAKKYLKPLDRKTAWAACQKFMRLKAKSTESLFRLSCYDADDLSAAGLKVIVQDWARQGWCPDLVVIDYADLLAAPPGIRDPRDQINKTWKQLRSIATKLHCCVVTATQSDADAYGRYLIDRKNFSEDKRKNATISNMYAINVTEGEKARQLCRLNTVMLRDGEFHSSRCIHVAGCLALARPAILSTY
jgi:hypothetical protein